MRRRYRETAGPIVINSNTQVLLQETEVVTEDTEQKEVSNVVETKPWGEVRRGTFSITVNADEVDKETGKKKVLYTNDNEPFEYDVVNSLPSALIHAGAKLSEDAMTFLSTALKSEDAEVDKANGSATSMLWKTYNAKLKADAKSSAYQKLVNKHKPLEGEKKESAQARLVANAIKLAGISAETAIDGLKTMKMLPEDYTVADFNATPLRRTKGSDEDE